MKFGKLVSAAAAELLPDLQHLCLRYKELKKLLKPIKPADDDNDSAPSSTSQTRGKNIPEAEKAFCDMLHEDVKALNAYFCDREEEVIMWLQQLDEQLMTAKTTRDKQLCHIGYIHLHGQLVLLFHWSMLNYAALVKILKKHDKHSGMELKAPVLSNALRQPFSTTGVLSSLMAKCEAKARDLNAVTGGLDQLLDACPHYQGLFLVKETEAALDLWTDLRTSASTPSTFLEPGVLRAIPANMRKRPRTESGGAHEQPAQPADASQRGNNPGEPAAGPAAPPATTAACSHSDAHTAGKHMRDAPEHAPARNSAAVLPGAFARTEGSGESDTSRDGSVGAQDRL